MTTKSAPIYIGKINDWSLPIFEMELHQLTKRPKNTVRSALSQTNTDLVLSKKAAAFFLAGNKITFITMRGNVYAWKTPHKI